MTVALGPTTRDLVRALEAAGATADGASVVAGHDEDYVVRVRGEEQVLVRMRGGRLEVRAAEAAEPRAFAFSRIDCEPDTLAKLAAGTLTPAEAADSGAMLVRSRVYGGGQFMRLLRVAQQHGLLPGAGA